MATIRIPEPPQLPPPPQPPRPPRIPTPGEFISEVLNGIARFTDNLNQSLTRGPLEFIKRTAQDIAREVRKF